MKQLNRLIGVLAVALLPSVGCRVVAANGPTENQVKEDLKKLNGQANAHYNNTLWKCSSGAKLVIDSIKISEIKADGNEATAHVAMEQHIEKVPPPVRTKDSVGPMESSLDCGMFNKPPTMLYGKMLYRKYDSEWRFISVENESATGMVESPPSSSQSEQSSNTQPVSPRQDTASVVGCSGQPDAHGIAEKVRTEIAGYEKAAGFRSPLDDQQFLQTIVGESAKSCVPPWLLFAQARFETTFGDPVNATTRDGMSFTDGSSGNAHNLFNIRPGHSWQGKVLDTGAGGQFRAYNSYDECVRDYLSVLVSIYKGKTLAQIINTYFPASENGSARVQGYIGSVVQFAATLGFTVDGGTIPIQ